MHQNLMRQVNAAFRRLRHSGVLAARFGDCHSCTEAAIANRLDEMTAPVRTAVKGVAYYTDQDREHAQRDGELRLSYGPFNLNHGKRKRTEVVGLEATRVGVLVSNALRAAGLTVEWDGDPGKRLIVRSTPSPIPS